MVQSKRGGFSASGQTTREGMELNEEIVRHEKRVTDIEDSKPFQAGNIANGEIVTAEIGFKGSADILTTVEHGLGRVPVGVIVMSKEYVLNHVRTHITPDLPSTYTETTIDIWARRGDATGSTVYTHTVDFWVF